jgi:hypothetical protein
MFIGHFAVAFAAKRAAPELSLGTLFLAAQLADLVWPTLVLLGVESFEIKPGATAVTPLEFTHYPWSHSLVAMVGWGFLLAILWLVVRRGTPWAALVIIGTVLSHWLLDVISHRPDLPLTVGGAARFGLGLWNSLPATLAVEGILFALCVALYVRATKPLDGIGRWGLWALVAFLAVVYLANLFAPPPPSTAAVAWTAQAIWLLVAWGYWVDRHRRRIRRSALTGKEIEP